MMPSLHEGRREGRSDSIRGHIGRIFRPRGGSDLLCVPFRAPVSASQYMKTQKQHVFIMFQ